MKKIPNVWLPPTQYIRYTVVTVAIVSCIFSTLQFYGLAHADAATQESGLAFSMEIVGGEYHPGKVVRLRLVIDRVGTGRASGIKITNSLPKGWFLSEMESAGEKKQIEVDTNLSVFTLEWKTTVESFPIELEMKLGTWSATSGTQTITGECTYTLDGIGRRKASYSTSATQNTQHVATPCTHDNDTTPPDIHFVGPEGVIVPCGGTLPQDYVLITDNCTEDGEILIEVEGMEAIDNSQPFNLYPITYRAMDTRGNISERVLPVIIWSEECPDFELVLQVNGEGAVTPFEGTRYYFEDDTVEVGIQETPPSRFDRFELYQAESAYIFPEFVHTVVEGELVTAYFVPIDFKTELGHILPHFDAASLARLDVNGTNNTPNGIPDYVELHFLQRLLANGHAESVAAWHHNRQVIFDTFGSMQSGQDATPALLSVLAGYLCIGDASIESVQTVLDAMEGAPVTLAGTPIQVQNLGANDNFDGDSKDITNFEEYLWVSTLHDNEEDLSEAYHDANMDSSKHPPMSEDRETLTEGKYPWNTITIDYFGVDEDSKGESGTVYPGKGFLFYYAHTPFTDLSAPYAKVPVVALPKGDWVFRYWVGERQVREDGEYVENTPLSADLRENPRLSLSMEYSYNLVAEFVNRPGIDRINLEPDFAEFINLVAPGRDIYTYDENGFRYRPDGTRYFWGNDIPQLAELLLLEEILKTPHLSLHVPNGVSHDRVWESWETNLAQVAMDMPSHPQSIQNVVAAFMTIGDLGTRMWLKETLLGLDPPVNLSSSGYNSNQSHNLSHYGDVNADGVSNRKVWGDVADAAPNYIEANRAFPAAALYHPKNPDDYKDAPRPSDCDCDDPPSDEQKG